MATENKGVMVYLPKEVEEYITEFCTEYNITRKDKEGNILPSLGTGIVTYLKSQMSGESPSDVLVKSSKSLGNGLTRDEVLDLIQQSVAPIDSPQSIGAIEKLVIAQIEPLAASFDELETYTQNQFKAVREELKTALGDRVTPDTIAPAQVDMNLPTATPKPDGEPSQVPSDDDSKSWAEFFKMVGIEALSATDAQKKENIDTRTEQIERGLQAAREQGLGEWVSKRAGRSFVRIGN